MKAAKQLNSQVASLLAAELDISTPAACYNFCLVTYFEKSNKALAFFLIQCLVLDNKSFIIYSATILFHESLLLFFLRLGQNEYQIFFLTKFQCDLAKNIVGLSNPDFVINFKHR